MKVTCLALVGSANEPIVLRNYATHFPDLHFHYLINTCLDVIDENASVTAGPSGREMFTGLLYALEDLAVYGYVTITRAKFIVVLSMAVSSSGGSGNGASSSVGAGVPSSGSVHAKEAEIRALFKNVHACYIAHMANPFRLGVDLESPMMDSVSSPRHRYLREALDLVVMRASSGAGGGRVGVPT
eukprot:Partr_v1_DN28704_c2_g1_i1_m63395 putative trafficking protein particle complex